jgi:hypothetical protein
MGTLSDRIGREMPTHGSRLHSRDRIDAIPQQRARLPGQPSHGIRQRVGVTLPSLTLAFTRESESEPQQRCC